MSTCVVDASVAVKWLVEEEGSAEAVRLSDCTLLAPELLLAECGNALWSKARRGELRPEEVPPRLRALLGAPITWFGLPELTEPAAALALHLGHPVYDCYYLALAGLRDATFVTADERLLGRLAMLSEPPLRWLRLAEIGGSPARPSRTGLG